MTAAYLIERAAWWAILVYAFCLAYRAGKRAEAAAVDQAAISESDRIVAGLIVSVRNAERFCGGERDVWTYRATRKIRCKGKRYLVTMERLADDDDLA